MGNPNTKETHVNVNQAQNATLFHGFDLLEIANILLLLYIIWQLHLVRKATRTPPILPVAQNRRLINA